MTQERERIEAEWGVMARACGNWRDFNPETPKTSPTAWEIKEYQAATRAILEHAECKTKLDQVTQERDCIEQLAKRWTLEADVLHHQLYSEEPGYPELYKNVHTPEGWRLRKCATELSLLITAAKP